MYSLELVTPPVGEPVALSALRSHLRLNLLDESASVLPGYLTAARQLFEGYTGRQLMPATYRLHLDSWPNTIHLPRPPLRSIVSVKYWDGLGVQQTVASTDYDVDTKREPARLVPRVFPGVHPYLRPAITVEYVAGYASAADVPMLIKQAIMLLTASYYENRESFTSERLNELAMGFTASVNQFKVGFITDMGM